MANPKKTFDFEELLATHHVRKTEQRLRVLSLMASKNTATSQPDLERVLDDVDRVTLYRTLNTFEEKGLIHKVFDLNGTANYALCSAACKEHEHKDEHLHFNCSVCKSVYCLDDLHYPPINVPNGFSTSSINIYATGVCAKCKK